jgi:hypothetical protein
VEKFLREQGKAPPAPPSCPYPVTIYHAYTGDRLDLPCKRRRCPFCGPHRWRPRTLARLHSGLHHDPQRYLVLLLTAPGDAPVARFNRNASYYWNRFWTSAQRWYPGLSYWKVAELQQRGHVHFHVILRGRSFIAVEQLRTLAVRSGFGAWVGIRRPTDYPGGARGAAWYLSKYLLKDYNRFAGLPTFVTMSRSWPSRWLDPVKPPSASQWIVSYELRRLKESAQERRPIQNPSRASGPPPLRSGPTDDGFFPGLRPAPPSRAAARPAKRKEQRP